MLARSADRVAKERSMRRRQLKWLWQRLHELQAMKLRREDLLMKLGAARQQAPSAWRLVAVEVHATEATFTYHLDKDKLRQVRRREGRYLLRSNLTETDPAVVWTYYLQLTEVEEAFRNLKGDLALRPIFHQERDADRGAHLRELPGVLPARDVGPVAADPGSGTDDAERPGEVRGGPDGRCAHPHHRRPHADPVALHPTGAGTATAVGAAEAGTAGPTAAPDHGRLWRQRRSPCSEDFRPKRPFLTPPRRFQPANPRSRAMHSAPTSYRPRPAATKAWSKEVACECGLAYALRRGVPDGVFESQSIIRAGSSGLRVNVRRRKGLLSNLTMSEVFMWRPKVRRSFHGSDRTPENAVSEKQCVAFRPQAIHLRARQGGRVDVRALEPFVPIPLVVDDPAVHVLLPERGAAVDAQAIEAEGVQLQPRGKAEAFQDVRSRSRRASRRRRTRGPGRCPAASLR